MAEKCHYFGLLLVVGLIALFPAKSVALFEYCENNNCTETGTICQADSNQCVCNGTTHYQTATLTCDAKVAADEACPDSLVDTQTPCLDLYAWCRQVGSEYKCTCNTGYSANNGQCVQVADCPDLNDPTNGVVQTSINAGSGNATYTCNQGYVINGSNNQSTIRICENGSWYDPEPTCSVLECDALTDPNNGVVVITNNTEGGIATYTCNEGYVFVGANNQQVATRQCSNGAWSNEAPTCSPIDCGSTISTITNGQATVVNQSTVNSTATVECNTGYQTSTNAVTCQADGNWSSAICALIDCGANIDTITKGQATVGTQTTVNSTATVECNTGYQTSTNTVTCQVNGNWSPATCTLIDCGSTNSTITNGQASVVAQTTVNTTATVLCNSGYETRTNTVTCQANGNWSSATCTIIDCGANIDTITNGQATLVDQSTVNSTATVLCNTGYQTSTNNVTCQANGYWSSATCALIDCGPTINTISNGQATVVDQTTVNSTATVLCNIGYNTSTTTVTCQANGNWSSATCTLIDCGANIDTITNGQATVDSSQTTVNSTATVQCNTGYETSTNTVICQSNGNWSSATCTLKDCGANIDTITNGQATIVGQTTVNSTATVQCNTGYKTSTNTVTCQVNGNWSPATCTLIDCGSTISTISNGQATEVAQTTVNSTATVECNSGYETSTSTVTCIANGNWSSATCSIIDCGSTISTITNGQATVGDQTTVNSTATVQCNTGYEITDGTVVTCQANGNWSSATCTIKDCSTTINTITNGQATEVDQTTVNSTASVQCNIGYETSTNTITCQADGNWSSATCTIKDCGDPDTAVTNGGATASVETTYESTASVTCDQGYETDTPQITCTAAGTWSTAVCTQQNCGLLLESLTYTVNTTSTTEGGVATYTCKTGYTIGDTTDTTSTRMCTGGSWTGTEPNCTRVDCGSLNNPTNGVVSSQDSVYNTVVTFTCNDGYTITAGNSSRTCKADGSWSGTQPTCSKKDCGDLGNLNNGVLTYNPNTKYLALATYTCNAGYVITGNPTATTYVRQCTASGTWDGEVKTCSKRDCGSSINTITNGQATGVTSTDYQSTATVACNEGYVNPTPTAVICQADGAWSTASCSPVNCGNINSITNGYGTGITSPVLGGTATVACNPGYENPTPTTITCQASGDWSSASCTIKDCGPVFNPVNGSVTASPNTEYGATAIYTCNSGYVITGTQRTTTETLNCTASGSWSESAPTCSRIDCYALQNPPNGQVTTAAGTTYESTVTYTCDTGFIISGTVSDTMRQVTCTATGTWSETVTCSAKADPLGATCPNPTTTVLTSGQLCSGDNAFCLLRSSDSQAYTCQCNAGFYDDNGNDPAGQCKPVSELAVQGITFQSVTTTTMRVTWTPPTNKANFISGYTVAWRPKGSNVVGSTSQVLSSTFFDITSDVTPGRAYTVTVTSRNQVDYTDADAIKTTSNQKEQALKPAKPGPINTASSNFDVENDKTMDLVWTASTGAVWYYEVKLYEVGSQDNELASKLSASSPTSLTYAQIKNGHRYDVTITAVSEQYDGQNTLKSETHREEIKTVVKAPSAPTFVQCVMTSDQSVTIKWQGTTTPNGDLVGYKIDTYQDGSNTFVKTNNKTSNVPDQEEFFTVEGLNQGSSYYFNVFTINEKSYSSAKRLQNQYCRTKAQAADAPNNLMVANIESRQFTVSWTRPNNTNGEHLGYVVQIRLQDNNACVKQLVIKCNTCSSFFKESTLQNMCAESLSTTQSLTDQVIESSAVQSYNFTDLNPDVVYSVTVTAVNVEGRGDIASETAQTEEEVPKKPKSVTITNLTATSSVVTWDIDGPRPGDTTYTVILNPVTPATYTDATVRGFTNRTHLLSGLEEYWDYSVTIRAETSKGSMDSDSVTFQTIAAAPGIVNSFSIIQHPNDDYRKMEVQWQLPVLLERNSVIDSFVLQHNTTQDMNNQMMTLNKNADDSFTYVQSFNVTPEVYYTFKVYAVNTENQNGAEKAETIMAPAGVPRNDYEGSVINESLATSSQTTLRLAFGTDFFTQDRNGDITLSGVIICAESKCPNNEVVTSLSKAQFETYPNWHDARQDGSKYRCTRPEWRQQANNGRKRRQTQTTEEFTIGTESCNETTQNEFCNGPLSPGTSYVVHVVICTNGGCLISNEYGPFVTQQVPIPPEDDNQVIIIVAVIVPVIVIIIAVIVVVFILRRRRKPSMSRMTETKMEANFEDTTTSMIKKKRPVKLSEFEDHLIKLHKDSNLLFSAEYDDLRTIAPSHPQEAANREENRLKNRYINILPFDHSRVKLFSNGEEDSSDYINGNYLPGINSPREYIGCQGPIPGTIDDFWRMVWEQKVSIVVMLTLCKEGQKVKCEQYWPDEQGEPKQYGDVVVEVTSTSTIQTYIMRIFKITNAGETRTIKHFHFLSWLDFQANVKHDIILDFITHVRSHVQPPDTKGPMIVHCSAGVGRTGTYICLDHLMQFIEEHDFDVNIDIFDMVLNLRNNRPLMVQTEQQYVFIHDCVKELMDRKRKQMENIYENQGFSTTDENIYQNTEPQLYENVQMKTPL